MPSIDNLYFVRRAVLCAAAFILTGGAAAAQGPSTNAPALRQTMTLAEIMSTGGWPMYVIGALSVLGLGLVLYFLFLLRGNQIMPERLVGEVQGLLNGGQLQQAREATLRRPCPLSAVARTAIDYATSVEQPDPGLLRELIEGEGARQAGALRNQIQYLMDIASIAPLIGLLGTVLGMLSAFNAVALDIARAKPMELAHGVSQALITTAAGLIVGIPALMAYAFFRGRTARLIAGLEAVSADVLTALVRRRSP